MGPLYVVDPSIVPNHDVCVWLGGLPTDLLHNVVKPQPHQNHHVSLGFRLSEGWRKSAVRRLAPVPELAVDLDYAVRNL